MGKEVRVWDFYVGDGPFTLSDMDNVKKNEIDTTNVVVDAMVRRLKELETPTELIIQELEKELETPNEDTQFGQGFNDQVREDMEFLNYKDPLYEQKANLCLLLLGRKQRYKNALHKRIKILSGEEDNRDQPVGEGKKLFFLLCDLEMIDPLYDSLNCTRGTNEAYNKITLVFNEITGCDLKWQTIKNYFSDWKADHKNRPLKEGVKELVTEWKEV